MPFCENVVPDRLDLFENPAINPHQSPQCRLAVAVDEMQQRRIKQANFVGPAGYIAMEDGYAAEIEQQAIVHDQDACSFLELGGTDVADAENLVSEAAMRGFWQYYREIMDF